MKKRTKYILLFLVLQVFFFAQLAWMLGFFALPAELSVKAPFLAEWANPGFLGFPLMVTGLTFVVANYFLTKAVRQGSESTQRTS